MIFSVISATIETDYLLTVPLLFMALSGKTTFGQSLLAIVIF